ncbi:MAG: hypothetical protein ACHP9Z_00705 [Streptosporangiales bacterium]
MANRIRGITELLDVDFEDPDSGSPSSSPAARACWADRPRRGAGRLGAEHIRLAVLRIPAKVHRGLLGQCRFITNGRRAGR